MPERAGELQEVVAEPRHDRRGLDEREEAFERLFRRYMPAVYGYALRRTTSPELAADVAAETFTVLWRRIDDVPAGDQARLWLYGVARRTMANARRGERRRSRLADRLVEVARVQSGWEGTLVREDSPSLVEVALGQLSSSDREILLLTAWEQLTPAEIAVVLGVRAVTVRSRLLRARRRMKALLPESMLADHENALPSPGKGRLDQSRRPDRPLAGERQPAEGTVTW